MTGTIIGIVLVVVLTLLVILDFKDRKPLKIQTTMSKITATIVADSISPQGHRITSLELVYPRIIHSEFMTHRMLSKNSASSRAIPFKKMVEMVKNDPFIPTAWQKDHPGMQGTEYLSKTERFSLNGFVAALINTLQSLESGSDEHKKLQKEVDEKVELISGLLSEYNLMEKTLDEWWLLARDKAVEAASILYVFRTTKQLANRLLEPFQYIKVLVTGTEWENFFQLRCPQYEEGGKIYRSWKDVLKAAFDEGGSRDWVDGLENFTTLQRLRSNKGQAEIHIMALAEAIWDAMNESTPKQLEAGEWHIPYGDKIDSEFAEIARRNYEWPEQYMSHPNKSKREIATGMAARTSYTTVGDEKEVSYGTLIGIHDKMLAAVPRHSSPFEHCARCMSDEEYYGSLRGVGFRTEDDVLINYKKAGETLGDDYWSIGAEQLALKFGELRRLIHEHTLTHDDPRFGWCRNMRGWIQYRHIIESGKRW